MAYLLVYLSACSRAARAKSTSYTSELARVYTTVSSARPLARSLSPPSAILDRVYVCVCVVVACARAQMVDVQRTPRFRLHSDITVAVLPRRFGAARAIKRDSSKTKAASGGDRDDR